MRIAVIDNLPDGGAKRVVFEQIKYLSKNNTIFYYTHQKKSFFNCQKYCAQTRTVNFQLKQYHGLLRPLYDLQYCTRLKAIYARIAQQITKDNCDIALVHPCTYTQAPWILSQLSIPTLYFMEETLRLVYEPELQPLTQIAVKKRLYELLRRGMVKAIDYHNTQASSLVATSSYFVTNQIADIYHRRAKVIPLAVDTAIFQPKKKSSTTQKISVTQPQYFLCIGQKIPTNGSTFLAQALQLYPEHPPIQWLQFNQNNFSVSDSELAELYRNSYATICLGKNEPFGLTALESMACGVPVIARNTGGYRETVTHGKTGWLITTPVSLAAALQQAARNKSYREKMGAQAREHVLKKFNWQKHGKKINLLLHLLSFQK